MTLQVIPAGSTAKFPIQLEALSEGPICERVEYILNGSHILSFEVRATAVVASLQLSEEKLEFQPNQATWLDPVRQVLTPYVLR